MKIAQASERKWRLLDILKVPLDPDIPFDNPNFYQFLRDVLSRFCGPGRKYEIWSSISAADVEVRQVRIPKVAKKQFSNSVYWTFKKEVPFDEQESFFDFQVQEEVSESGIRKIAVLAYAVPWKQVRDLKNLFVKSGFPLTGITITPFAHQNLFRTGSQPQGAKTICNLYIGRDWSRIDIFNNGNLVLTRGIKTGINSMVEEIVGQFNRRYAEREVQETGSPEEPELTLEIEGPAGESRELEAPTDDAIATAGVIEPLTLEEARRLLFSRSEEAAPLSEEEPGAWISGDELFEYIMPAVERLIRQVERTLQYFATTYGEEPVGQVYVSGRLETYTRLVQHLGEQLGVGCDLIDPLAPGYRPASETAIPESVAERLEFAPALGLALSDNSRTPNFLFTQKDKDRLARAGRLDRLVFGVFLLLAAAGAGFYFWQSTLLAERETRLTELGEELARYRPEPQGEYLMKMTAKVAEEKQRYREYSHRYRDLAVIGELTALTPAHISLLSSSLYLGPPGGRPAKNAEMNLVLDGVVNGERAMLESLLAGYLLRLAGSPLFTDPTVHKSQVEEEADSEVLHFVIHVKLKS